MTQRWRESFLTGSGALAFAVLLILLAIFSLGRTEAQIITGSLTGIVMDSSSAVVPGATVTMTNERSGDIRRTTTNSEGYFSISGVLPGSYTVTIEHPGFQPYKAEKVTFNAGDRRTLGEVVLQVATTGTEVSVTAVLEELTPVDTGEKNVVLSQQQMQNVAIVGRSAAEYIKILPGMAFISPGVENRPGFNGENIGINGNGDGGKQSTIGNFSANGTRPEALDIVADGSHVSDPGCNCANPVNPNPEMIEEFKVQQSNFGAENAKGPVVLNSITKAGGRDFHGSAYLYARHYSLNANDWLNNAQGTDPKTGKPVAGRPNNKYFFPGGTFSGPVLLPGTKFNRNRDKLFFFTGYENFRQTIDTGLLRSVVHTEAMRQGDFSDTDYLAKLRNAAGIAATPLKADRYPGGRIPASQLDQGMLNLVKLTPLPNTDPGGAGNGYNYARVLVIDQNMWQSLSRIDYNISDNTKLFVRYNRQNELQPFPIQLWWRNAGAVPLPTPIEGKNRTDSVSFNFTKVLSPSLTNETVFGYTFVDFPNSYKDYNKMTRAANNFPYKGIFKQDDKIPAFWTWSAPTAGMYTTGGFDPILFATKHLVTLTDTVSKVAGTHTIKFGGYYGYIRNNQPGNANSNGDLIFDTWSDSSTGNVLGDYVAGLPIWYQEATKQIARDIKWNEIAFFAQDSWKVTPRFTLEYGLRIQHMQPWTARNGIGIATWVPSAYNPNAPSAELPGILWHAKDKSVPLAGWQTRALYYSPRFGFAWDIFGKGKTVIRGGYGMFYYHDPQLAADAMDMPAGVRSTTVCCGLTMAGIDATATQGSLAFGGTAVDGRDDRQPRTQSYSFTISQRLPSRTLLEVSYVGNKSDNLINTGFQNINRVPIGAMLNDPGGDTNAYRPLRNYQDLNVPSHKSYSNYNSLQVFATKQAGWSNYTLAYTWSKAMGILTNPILALPERMKDNYGPLSFDRTHVLAASYVLNIPDLVKTGNPVAKGIANGWQISGIVQATSGVNIWQNTSNNFAFQAPSKIRPGNTMSAMEVTGTDAWALSPILVCNPRANLGPRQYMNAACFAPPIAGQNGQLGVNGPIVMPYFRGPGFFNTDLSVFKNFRWSESRNVQLRFSAYNMPNHPNVSFVNNDQNLRMTMDAAGRVTNPRFGFADSKVGRRIVQLGIRFLF